jgi:hypothetical protein
MGLYERWTYEGDTPGEKIQIHRFGAAMSEHARGAMTRQQVIDAFALAGADVSEFDAIASAYTSLPTQAEKDARVSKFEDVMILCETGDYARAKAASELGF